MEETNDPDTLAEWVGRTETSTDLIGARTADWLAKTLDLPAGPTTGERLPPLWHFCYFLEADRISELGRDGHGLRGSFLPPIKLPRRMWAGSRINFVADVRIGDTVERNATVSAITHKEGSSGPLIFVTVTYEYSVDGKVCLTEDKDLVYRGDPASDTAPPRKRPAPEAAGWTQRIDPGPVMLFRYSALTFNNHRIHYDRDYARDIEGYDGLVVHGPLTATLLAGLGEAKTGLALSTFSFRGVSPLTDQPFTIDGTQTADGADLWASTGDGDLAMTASATFSR